ncbi:hypothetical protein MC885_008562 [Smutsia gigantea]|nr:hypothetical protein MC885_008562 [Smutsia gigantea]
MEGTESWGWPCLLLLLWVSGFHAVGEEEIEKCLEEGRNLTLGCVYNIMLFSSSLKAWQRVESQGLPKTLVHTTTRNLNLNQARAGRYLLEDRPSDAIMRVTITELQPQDLGLYQCVIYLSPQNSSPLFPRIRLKTCKENGTSSRNPTQKGNPDSRMLAPDTGLPVLVIVLTCGFILNKGLVFSVLFVLLQKGLWSPWTGGRASPRNRVNGAGLAPQDRRPGGRGTG